MTRVICPFCLSILLIGTIMEGELCPECELGDLINYEEYIERIRSSKNDDDRSDTGQSLREED